MMEGIFSNVRAWLQNHPRTSTASIAVTASLGYMLTYFIRYPLFVLPASPDDKIGELQVKVWYSLASNVGYGVSKLPAYFIVPTVKRNHRIRLLMVLCGLMMLFTVAFWKFLPVPARILGIFLGGLPGSWVYAIVFSFFEGRMSTELLNAVLNLVIICGGALSRAVGESYLRMLDDKDWMPLAVAATLAPFSAACFIFLGLTPGPSEQDTKNKAERRVMHARERLLFLKKFAPGIVAITLCYACIISFRSLRDYFALEVYTSVLGVTPAPWVYIVADWPAGVLTSMIMVAMTHVKDNRLGLLILLGMCLSGAVIVGISTTIYMLSGAQFVLIVGVGLGLYLMWAPLPALVYDRLLAASMTPGTVMGVIFMSDCAGYVGTTALLLYKGLGSSGNDKDLEDIFIWAALALAVIGICTIGIACFYFVSVLHHKDSEHQPLLTGDKQNKSAASRLLQLTPEDSKQYLFRFSSDIMDGSFLEYSRF
eukprot:m.35565 g.35565  ORF g.35565 m.35565 type:complete len:481 (+) comp8893_c0_seq2:361-1803(+)